MEEIYSENNDRIKEKSSLVYLFQIFVDHQIAKVVKRYYFLQLFCFELNNFKIDMLI